MGCKPCISTGARFFDKPPYVDICLEDWVQSLQKKKCLKTGTPRKNCKSVVFMIFGQSHVVWTWRENAVFTIRNVDKINETEHRTSLERYSHLDMPSQLRVPNTIAWVARMLLSAVPAPNFLAHPGCSNWLDTHGLTLVQKGKRIVINDHPL